MLDFNVLIQAARKLKDPSPEEAISFYQNNIVYVASPLESFVAFHKFDEVKKVRRDQLASLLGVSEVVVNLISCPYSYYWTAFSMAWFYGRDDIPEALGVKPRQVDFFAMGLSKDWACFWKYVSLSHADSWEEALRDESTQEKLSHFITGALVSANSEALHWAFNSKCFISQKLQLLDLKAIYELNPQALPAVLQVTFLPLLTSELDDRLCAFSTSDISYLLKAIPEQVLQKTVDWIIDSFMDSPGPLAYSFLAWAAFRLVPSASAWFALLKAFSLVSVPLFPGNKKSDDLIAAERFLSLLHTLGGNKSEEIKAIQAVSVKLKISSKGLNSLRVFLWMGLLPGDLGLLSNEERKALDYFQGTLFEPVLSAVDCSVIRNKIC